MTAAECPGSPSPIEGAGGKMLLLDGPGSHTPLYAKQTVYPQHHPWFHLVGLSGTSVSMNPSNVALDGLPPIPNNPLLPSQCTFEHLLCHLHPLARYRVQGYALVYTPISVYVGLNEHNFTDLLDVGIAFPFDLTSSFCLANRALQDGRNQQKSTTVMDDLQAFALTVLD